MREIKYRLWYRKIDNGCVGEGKMAMHGTRSILDIGDQGHGYGFIYRDGEMIPHRDTIFMQYTGLRDVAGKEIYEGDIITGFEGSEIGYVEWSVEDAGFRYRCMDKTSEMTCGYFVNVYRYCFRIHGNIYEDRDLICK